MTIDRALFDNLRQQINLALTAVANTHGLRKLEATNARVNPEAGHFTFKLEGVLEGGIDRDAARYNQARQSFHPGLPPLGTEFTAGTVRYRITGLNSTGSKVHVTRVNDSRPMLYTTAMVISICARQAA